MLSIYIYILTEYHMRNDNMSAENRLLITALKMSQILPRGAKRPPGLRSHVDLGTPCCAPYRLHEEANVPSP